jgi:hypothetical protein
MLYEATLVFVAVIGLGLVGVGPALWLLEPQTKPRGIAIYIAPALGLAIVGLVGFPLVRYVGPIQQSGHAAALILVLISAVLAVTYLRNHRSQASSVNLKSVGFQLLFVSVCLVALTAPIWVYGIQYAIFRSNISDAFLYLSLAETVRLADWQTIQASTSFTQDNWKGLAELVSISPTALFTSRQIGLSFVLNNSAAMAWLATLADVPVYRLFHVYNVICLGCALPLTIAIAKHLALDSILVYLAAAAVVLGFWARYILETDSAGEIASLPVLMLAVFAWMLMEHRAGRIAFRLVLLGALGIATVICFNYPELILLLGGMGIYFAVSLVQRTTSWSKVGNAALLFFVAVMILLLTGQFDYIWGNFLRGLDAFRGVTRFPDFAYQMLLQDHIATAWGMPRIVLFTELPSALRWVLRQFSLGIGILMSGMLLASAFFVFKDKQAAGRRILLSLAVASLILTGAFLMSANPRGSGKAFTYAFPYLMMSPLVLPSYIKERFGAKAQLLLVGVLGVWLGLQILLTFYLPFSPLVGGIFRQGDRFRQVAFDLEPILQELDRVRPTNLMVDVRRHDYWGFAFYAMFATAEYRPYFQSGIVVDNNTTFRNLWFRKLSRAPDYALILKRDDYIGQENLGEELASTKDLVLYRYTSQNTGPLSRELREIQTEEEAKPLFPTLE